MIILEGVDRTGKTSLAMELQRRLYRWSYRHTTRPMLPEAGGGCYKYRMWQLADTGPRMIVDRCHWSDFVYGLVYRDSPCLSLHTWRYLELAFLSRGAKVLYMVDTLAGIQSRWDEKEMHPPDEIPALIDRYRELTGAGEPDHPFGPSHLPSEPVLYHEITEAWLSDQCRWADNRANTVDRLPVPAFGVGGYDAEFLVIGTRAWGPPDGVREGVKSGCEPDLPFFRGFEGERLWAAMDAAGVQWWKGYYTVSAAWTPRALALALEGPLRNVRVVLNLNQTPTVRLAVDCLGKQAKDRVECRGAVADSKRFDEYVASALEPWIAPSTGTGGVR